MSFVVAIVGPTASGKSKVADLVAHKFTSSVISVDAMQVYRCMNIGTAKEDPKNLKAPLLMVDVADIGVAYSVALYQKDARKCIDNLIRCHKIPVLCGGTGLYLDAIIDDMNFPKGEIKSTPRSHYQEIADNGDSEILWDLLNSRDSESAALIHPNNIRRVIRALELLDSGKSYAKQHKGLKKRKPVYESKIYSLKLDRDKLYERIDNRVEKMFEVGLLDEVKGLVDRGFEDALTSMQAIGYKEIIDYLNNKCTLEEAKEHIKQASRRYAKRQISWIKRDGRAHEIDMDLNSTEDAVNFILEDIKNK